MHIHILGICGTFMGGIAVIARQAGHKVTGCDANVYPPMSTQLQAQGIELIEGFDAAQIELKPDLFVIGNVVSRGNPLMEEILNRGLAFISGPQWLYENVLRGKWVLAAAGTHGKTTTTSMLAWILEHAGLNPGFLIGGVPINFDVSARVTDSAFFVIEADEYDTAFFDKRSKFVHYMPRTAILNNLEFDHADIFPDMAAIETQFHHLVRTVPGNGLIIANGREQSMKRVLARGVWSKVELFGVDEGWIARPRDEHAFDVFFEGDPRGTVQWDLLGEHNRHNALAALAAARHAGVPVSKGIEALAEFRNVKRRLEVRGAVNDITIYDDFAHHPTAIETTIAGLAQQGRRRAHPCRPGTALEHHEAGRDEGGAGGESCRGRPGVLLYQRAGLGCRSPHSRHWVRNRPASTICAKLTEAIAAASRPGDHVLIMSNGGFGGIHSLLLEALRR